jgi:hypothetical protein
LANLVVLVKQVSQELVTGFAQLHAAAWLETKHRLKVLVSESQRIGVAKLAENLPRGFVTTSLDEQLVQEQKSFQSDSVSLNPSLRVSPHNVLHVSESVWLQRSIETPDLRKRWTHTNTLHNCYV